MTDIADYNYKDLSNILRLVSTETGIPTTLIKSKSRKREITEARQIYCVCAKANTSSSLSRIGTLVNYKDHTSVKNAIDTLHQLYDSAPIYRDVINKVNSSLSKQFTIKRIKIKR